MQILLGVLSTGIVELIKILTKRFDRELTENAVHTAVFIVVAIGTYMISTGILSWETINNYIQIFVSSYATYQLILNPSLKKLGVK